MNNAQSLIALVSGLTALAGTIFAIVKWVIPAHVTAVTTAARFLDHLDLRHTYTPSPALRAPLRPDPLVQNLLTRMDRQDEMIGSIYALLAEPKAAEPDPATTSSGATMTSPQTADLNPEGGYRV